MTPESMGHDLTRDDSEQQQGGKPVETVAAEYKRVVAEYENRIKEESKHD